MSLDPTASDASPIAEYIEEGARIAAIILVWGVIAAFFAFVVTDFGGPGGLFADIGAGLGWAFSLTGLLNAVLYICLRTVDHYRR